METKNKVMLSIAIPFYNAEQFLSRSIESVINQTFRDWDLILIDDGSIDTSLQIAKSYEAKDDRIKVISDGENRNLSYRLNQIPTFIKTDYLARMDADDIMHPEKIEKQMTVLLQNPEIDVLGTNAFSIDENDMVFGIRYKETNKDCLLNVKSFIHPTIIAKTQWFRDNKYDDKALRIEDTELWYRTCDNNNFKMLSEPLFFYREIGNGYYKKYFQANSAKDYILKKYNKNIFWRIFFKGNIIKGVVYQMFNLFGKEDCLVSRRNQIVLKNRKNYKNFYTYD